MRLLATLSLVLDYITVGGKKSYSLGNFQKSVAEPKYTDLEYIVLEQSGCTAH